MKPNAILYALRPDTGFVFPVQYREGTFYYCESPVSGYITELAGKPVEGISADDVHQTEIAARKALVGRLTLDLDRAKRALAYGRTRKKELRVKLPAADVEVPLPLPDLEPEAAPAIEAKRRRKEAE